MLSAANPAALLLGCETDRGHSKSCSDIYSREVSRREINIVTGHQIRGLILLYCKLLIKLRLTRTQTVQFQDGSLIR